MASVDNWRTCLNDQTFCKHLRENNAKDSRQKISSESKSLAAVQDSDLYVWDSYLSQLIYFNLKHLLPDSHERQSQYQTLLCTDVPRFDVDCLVFNQSGSYLAVWGQCGISVIELPQRWGKFAEFDGGKFSVSCKSVSIAEHYFASHKGVQLLQVLWHPGSEMDTHITFLTSDNTLSTYDIQEPNVPLQVIHLGDRDQNFSQSPTKRSYSAALGESATCFDFGPPLELGRKQKNLSLTNRDSYLVWPVYVVKGNGDVLIAYVDINESGPLTLPVQGPLTMHPPAEDNYGLDACFIQCIGTSPPVLVISTCEGKLHHCVVLSASDEDASIQSDSVWNTTQNRTVYESPSEISLYVYESIELELSLTTHSINTDQPIEDDFTCPIKLYKDPLCLERYHCSHAAGVHTVVLPWIQQFSQFCMDDQQECVVEHLICTKPLPSRTRYQKSSTLLVSSSPSKLIPSPLKQIQREPFDQYVAKLLQRSVSNPVFKSGRNTELSQQECFQLLSHTFIKEIRHHMQFIMIYFIQIDISPTQQVVRILTELKSQQLEDLDRLTDSKNNVREKAQDLAIKCDDCQEKHEEILRRIETVMRKLQSRLPVLSEAERSMKRELENMDEKLDTYKRSLQQLKIKQDYQRRQIEQKKKSNIASPVLQKNQHRQLKEIIKQERRSGRFVKTSEKYTAGIWMLMLMTYYFYIVPEYSYANQIKPIFSITFGLKRNQIFYRKE
ncbi:hypothetical protein KUTeg_009379 [Tegillarca granosa]|uniref:Nuclear pore complex protein Nup88 n=1 Tax=Tegillarca granosa TaxID=220873 RepID=A0ABQ9F3P3_TEGGR|nr:hypothetical protein KUTeg_009379 [Tegillarca granosa]